MLLGGARQERPAAGRHRTPPDDVLAALHRAGEYLVLQVAVQQLGVFGEAEHFAGFRERPSERLLAGDADELRPARRDQSMDLAHGIEPGEVRHADPDRIDLARKQHRLERRKRAAGAELERVGFRGQCLAVCRIWAEGAGDRHMPHIDERLQMEVGDEA
jgi:hypothetical protein